MRFAESRIGNAGAVQNVDGPRPEHARTCSPGRRQPRYFRRGRDRGSPDSARPHRAIGQIAPARQSASQQLLRVTIRGKALAEDASGAVSSTATSTRGWTSTVRALFGPEQSPRMMRSPPIQVPSVVVMPTSLRQFQTCA
jgi:hypothetical protein